MSDARKRVGTSEEVVNLTTIDEQPAIHVGKCLVAITKQLREVMSLTEYIDISDDHRVALNQSVLDAGRNLQTAAEMLERGLRERSAMEVGDQPGVS